LLEEGGDEAVQRVSALLDEGLGALEGLEENPTHLGLDGLRRRVAHAVLDRQPLPEERMLHALLVKDWSHLDAHPVLGDHLEREVGGDAQVIFGPRGDVAEQKALRGVPSHEHA